MNEAEIIAVCAIIAVAAFSVMLGMIGYALTHEPRD